MTNPSVPLRNEDIETVERQNSGRTPSSDSDVGADSTIVRADSFSGDSTSADPPCSGADTGR